MAKTPRRPIVKVGSAAKGFRLSNSSKWASTNAYMLPIRKKACPTCSAIRSHGHEGLVFRGTRGSGKSHPVLPAALVSNALIDPKGAGRMLRQQLKTGRSGGPAGDAQAVARDMTAAYKRMDNWIAAGGPGQAAMRGIGR
ncbi:MAG: hypothetical protein QOD07_1848 [Frankiaceae bacterium]|nr:hypothetical protein [Frankiaceae bacterium]